MGCEPRRTGSKRPACGMGSILTWITESQDGIGSGFKRCSDRINGVLLQALSRVL